jgi:hypothetical protein
MLWIALLVVLAPMVVMALSIDDWSRDLTTNRAWTESAPGAKLAPVDAMGGPDEVSDKLKAFCAANPAWALVDDKPLPDDSALAAMLEADTLSTHHLVRTTALMRWKDDVWVVVERREGGVRLHAESRSRVGKGDLGQNPRNLRELLGALD